MGPGGNFYYVRHPDIYVSNYDGSVFSAPRALPQSINNAKVSGPCLSPNGRYMLLHSIAEDNFGGFDIYLAFRDSSGGWDSPINLGPPINTAAHESNPTLSPDGQYLFFRRSGGDGADFYWVQSTAIMR